MTFFDHICANDDSTRVHMEKKSVVRLVQCGVPQESVNSLNANDIRLYVDDTGVFMHNKNIHNLIKQANTSFRKLHKWLCNKLSFNRSNLISVYFI